jgi:hypothetical protein
MYAWLFKTTQRILMPFILNRVIQEEDSYVFLLLPTLIPLSGVSGVTICAGLLAGAGCE